MRTLLSIRGLTVPRAQRSSLALLYPRGLDDLGYFNLEVPTDDPIVEAVIGWLHDHGYTPWIGKDELDRQREYPLNYIRQYDASDFADVEYMEFWPELVDSVGSGGRNEGGHLQLERPTLKKAKRANLDFAHLMSNEILVVEPVRDLLLAGGFKHLVFRPTVLVTGRGTLPGRNTPIPWSEFKVTPPWWELTSDFRMPPLARSVQLVNGKEEPFRPSDPHTPCRPREGFYNHAELHYRRSDLAQLEPFDVALTFENFGFTHREHRATIVSKRFFDFAQSHGLRGRWAPVRLDTE